MSSHLPPNPHLNPMLPENSYQDSQTFADSVAQVKALVLQRFDREVAEKQLCYHTREHIAGVQRRANQLFHSLHPYLPASGQNERSKLLLDLCAIAHDLIQIFVPHPEPHGTRRREAGVSEYATIEELYKYIHALNSGLQNPALAASRFTQNDLQTIHTAIAATICDYDITEQAIFQPALYNAQQDISPVARILALADIGALGMEGIEAYNAEGSLLFLEENLDVRSLLENGQLENLSFSQPDLEENIRQRLLKRTRFQVNFAKSRLKRCPRELEGFSPEAALALKEQAFPNLTAETIQEIEATTPTAVDTPFKVLIQFFQFEQMMADIAA